MDGILLIKSNNDLNDSSIFPNSHDAIDFLDYYSEFCSVKDLSNGPIFVLLNKKADPKDTSNLSTRYHN